MSPIVGMDLEIGKEYSKELLQKHGYVWIEWDDCTFFLLDHDGEVYLSTRIVRNMGETEGNTTFTVTRDIGNEAYLKRSGK